MNLQRVKPEDIQKCCLLDGIRVVEVRRGAYDATSVTLADAAGHMMAIEGSEYFCTIHVLTPPTPKKEKRYLVIGDMCMEGISQDVKVNETLNSMADAVERKQMLEEVGGKNFSIKEIEIELQEAE